MSKSNDPSPGVTTRLSKRNLIFYSASNIGRVLATGGLWGNLMNYVYFTKQLTASQLSVLTAAMFIINLFDAFNDPVMGGIVDITRSRIGKFKPWISVGMVGTVAVYLATFCNNFLGGWEYVAFFIGMYLLNSIFYTLNDVAHNGMMPALTNHAGDRDKLSALSAFLGSISSSLHVLLVPLFTAGSLTLGGNSVSGYKYLSIVFCGVFIVFECLTLFGVKPPEHLSRPAEKGTKLDLKEIFGVIAQNDQLRWMAVTKLFMNLVPYGAIITMFIYFHFSYEGVLLTYFGLLFAAGTVIANVGYPFLAKKFSRKGLMKAAAVSVCVGAAGMIVSYLAVPEGVLNFKVPFIDFECSLQFLIMAIFYFFVGFATYTYSMLSTISFANIVEYHEYKTGKRREGAIQSLSTFIGSLIGSLSSILTTGYYILVGVYAETNRISKIEQMTNMGKIDGEQKKEMIDKVLENIPDTKKFLVLIMCTAGLAVSYVIAYFIYKKKYIITEENFDKMVAEIEERKKNEAVQ